MDRIDEIDAALAKIEIERQGKIDGIIGPGIAFLELCAEATNSTFLTADDVKNSASPSQSTSSPTSSKAAGKARKRGLSTAKAIPETPES
jgi:hypothetical protein